METQETTESMRYMGQNADQRQGMSLGKRNGRKRDGGRDGATTFC